MGLVKIKTIGYGLDGNKLDLTIAVPKGSYVDAFYVANQNDINITGSTEVGIEYISAVQARYSGISKETAFNKLFTLKGEYIDTKDGNTYELYELNQNCEWFSVKTTKTYIYVSQNDLTYITLHLHAVPNTGFVYSDQCGEDNMVTVFPLYNLLMLRLRALSSAKFVGQCCELPEDFIDKILQIKTIELANSSKDYYRAATYWNKFYKGKNIATNKRCGCHG